MSYKKNKFFIERKIKAFKFLMETFDLNIKEAQRWIDKKRLLVDGQVLSKKSETISGEVEVIVFTPSTKNLSPIFETSEFALYDKPSGVLVHPANRDTNYSLTHEIKYKFGKDANITHRIDKETSGLVLIAKNKKCEISIKRAFENKEVNKTYLAYIVGKINSNIIIDEPILKNNNYNDIKLKVFIDKRGKASLTKIEPIFYDPNRDITLIKAIPLTGRQHQIRAHLNHIGHPIVGDPIYGQDNNFINRYLDGIIEKEERIKYTGASRLLLHAQRVDFCYKNRFIISSKYDFISYFSSHQK